MILRAAKQVVKEFGPRAQWIGCTSKFHEEQEELNYELFLMEYTIIPQPPERLIDELADVIFLLIQIIIHYKLSPLAIIKRIRYKARRTLDRIASGYYSCSKNSKRSIK